MKISYYNSSENYNFNPQEYVGFIKDSKEQGVTSLVWKKLFNTTESLAEIASSVTIDMEFNRRDEGSNRVMMFKYAPDDNHRKLRKDIFKILREKWNILRSSGLTEREVFEVFKFSNFKYLNAIPHLVGKKDLQLQIKHEIEVIEDMKKEPQISTDESVTLVDEPILSEYTSTESISTKNEPDFSKAGEYPTMQTLEQEKLKQAAQFSVLEETSSENVKADINKQTQSEIQKVIERSLSGDDGPSLSGDDHPALNDHEPRLTDEIPIHERRTVETPKNVAADVEERTSVTRRGVLKGLGIIGLLTFGGKFMLSPEEIPNQEQPVPSPTEKLDPVPSVPEKLEQTPVPGPKLDPVPSVPSVPSVPQKLEESPGPEPIPEPVIEEDLEEVDQDLEEVDQDLENLNRDELIEKLKIITQEYSKLKGKQSFDLLAESETNTMLVKAINIIRLVNLSAQELIDLKLIRKSNLKKFKKDKKRLEEIFKLKMSASDNWIISSLITKYESNPIDMSERFKDGALYKAMETVSAELKKESLKGDPDTLDKHSFLKDILFSAKFIEAVLMIEGGLRGENFSNLAKTEITRSIINSGQFNPNFGSIVEGNLRIGINHILTYYFIRGGKGAPGAVINNKYARAYFKKHGILEKDGYDYRLKKSNKFTVKNRRKPTVNAPTETKIAEILTNPEESIKLMLMSYRENLHYLKDVITDNLDRLNEYSKIIDNFWIKIIALTNICGGPLTKKLIKELAKHEATKENYLMILNQKNKAGAKIYHPDYAEKVDNILTSIQNNPPINETLNLNEAQASNLY